MRIRPPPSTAGDGSELGSYSIANRLDRTGHENKFDPTLDEFREYMTILPSLAETKSIRFCIVIDNLDPEKMKSSEEIRGILKPLLEQAASTWNQLLQQKPKIGNLEFPDWPVKKLSVAFGCAGEDVVRTIVDPTHWKLRDIPNLHGTIVDRGKSPDGKSELVFNPELFNWWESRIQLVVLHEYGHLFGIEEHYFGPVLEKGKAFGIMEDDTEPSVHDRVAIWNIWRYTKLGGEICPADYYERGYVYMKIDCISKAFLSTVP